jgi:hypothetical protein
MSQKARAAQREENTALADKIDAHLKTFDEYFAVIEAMKDPAEKILRLQDLDICIREAKLSIKKETSALIDKRAKRSAKTVLKRTGLVIASLPLFTTPITMVLPSWTSQSSIEEKSRELKGEVNVEDFQKTIAGYEERVAKMLDRTVKDCDLTEIHKSRHFPDALHGHEPLRKKFEAAAIVRAAIGDEELKPSMPQPGQARPSLKA